MWKIFLAGGPVMWPLLLCSLTALTVIVERCIFWLRADVARDRAGIEDLLEDYRLGKPPRENRPAARGAVMCMLLSGLAHRHYSCSRAMETVAQEELKKMRRGMSILDTIITAAPMLGILGTVIGIILSFDMLGQAGVEDPQAVVSGIAQALITTAAGLIISIVTLFPFNYFNARIDDAQELFENYGTRLEILQRAELNQPGLPKDGQV